MQDHKPSTWRYVWRFVAYPWIVVLALLFWLEEWLWDPLAHWMRQFSTLPLVRWLAARLAAAPPYVALGCFAIPVLCLLPFKLVGLWLLGRGNVVLGVSVFIGAKVLGTAIGAWIFTLTQVSLMRLAWFARLWQGIVRLRTWLYARVTTSVPWRWAQGLRQAVRQWWAR